MFSLAGPVAGRAPRAALDLLKKKRKDDSDETLGALLRRRLGDEATDRAVAPLLAGLYAGDIDRLSVRATFPELERVGSVARQPDPGGAGRQRGDARRGPTRARCSCGPEAASTG